MGMAMIKIMTTKIPANPSAEAPDSVMIIANAAITSANIGKTNPNKSRRSISFVTLDDISF